MKISIGSYLVILVCVVALPILSLVIFLLIQLESNARDALERSATREARSLAAAVSPILQEMATTVRLVATAPELESGDLESFHKRTQAALRASSMFVLLVERDGRQLLNTRVPFGTELDEMSNPADLKSDQDSKRLEVSEVFLEKTSGKRIFNVTLPLPETASAPGRTLIITKNSDEFNTLITTAGLPADWFAAVLDQFGSVVASSNLPASAQAALSIHFSPAARNRSEGVIYQHFGGSDDILGFARPFRSNWITIVGGPIETAQVSLRQTWQWLIVGCFVLLGCALIGAYLIGKQLSTSTKGIAVMAEDVGNGHVAAPISSSIREFDMVAKALSDASFDRSQAEDHIRLILHELAHRTKNMLTVVQAIIRQTARRSETVAEFQKALETRVSGIAHSIDLLTAEKWAGVPIRRLMETHLSTFIESPDQLEMRGEDFPLAPDAVQNLGLVLHELSTNAVKYGAFSTKAGKVTIDWETLRCAGDEPRFRLTWTESGGPPVAPADRRGFGSEVIERHASAAFGGKVDMGYPETGFVWSIVAPAQAFGNVANAGTGLAKAKDGGC